MPELSCNCTDFNSKLLFDFYVNQSYNLNFRWANLVIPPKKVGGRKNREIHLCKSFYIQYWSKISNHSTRKKITLLVVFALGTYFK